jgi:hypothetical protein
MLEARLDGNLWCSLQINVVDADLSANPIRDDRALAFLAPQWNVLGRFEPTVGSVPVALGILSVARIPVPGTNLVVELNSRGYKGSTSTVFIWEKEVGKGKFGKCLRLDYGYNVKTKTVDYHWNREGPAKMFWGIQDHTPAGATGEALWKAGKYLRWGGRVLLVVSIAVDAVSIATASNRLRKASEVVSGWAFSWAGCETGGAFGAGVGTGIEPGGGTAIGAFVGCIIGGSIGYWAGSKVGADVYDWAENTVFTPLPEITPN